MIENFYTEGLKNTMYFDTLKMLQGILTKGLENASEYPLKKIDNVTLLYIAFFPNQPMSFYSEKLNIENGSFNYIANKIMELGLVEIVQHEEDKRKKVLVLTKKGHEEVLRTQRDLDKHIENRLKVLSEVDRELFDTTLNTLRELAEKIKGKGETNESK